MTATNLQREQATAPDAKQKTKSRKRHSRLSHTLSSSVLRIPLEWVRHRGLRPTDVFFASYPRSGRTWSRFVLHEILTGHESTFESVNQALRGVYSLSHGMPVLPGGGRVVNTHESYRKEYKRAFCLVRDVRDVVLSEYAFLKGLGFVEGSLDEFVARFLGVGAKINGYGIWPRHVASWLDSPIAGTPNFLLIRYEELRREPELWFGRMVDFLGVQVDKDKIKRAVDHNSLREMKEKERSQPQIPSGDFVRTGTIQGWRGKLTDSQLELIEKHAGSVLVRLGYPLCAESPELATVQSANMPR